MMVKFARKDLALGLRVRFWASRIAVVPLLAGLLVGSAAAASGKTAAKLEPEVTVAVAANFTGPAKKIAAAFEQKTGTRVVLSFGATGGLYAQISQGAPVDVFLAADLVRPQKALDEGLAQRGSLFTYALGELVLYAPGEDVGDGAAVLKAGLFNKLAVADPKAAPYGAAGLAALKALGLLGRLESKLVYGANVTQTLQYVVSGNAELGFVAASQVLNAKPGEVWRVPTDLYPAISQGAVVLAHAPHPIAAEAFAAFLKGPQARLIITQSGYKTAPDVAMAGDGARWPACSQWAY